MVALRQTLNPQDELKIIMDRRRSSPSTEAPSEPAERRHIERRRHPYVDVALNVDGFAIVPASAGERPPGRVLTVSSPVESPSRDEPSRDEVKVEAIERRQDDADPPRPTETPARASRPDLSAHPEEPREAPGPGQAPAGADVDDADPQGHRTGPPGPSDRSQRGPNRRVRNPQIQRLFPDDDASVGNANVDTNDDEPLSRPGDRRPQFPAPRIPSGRGSRARATRSWHGDEPFGEDEPRRRSALIWIATVLVAVIAVLVLLLMGQAITAINLGHDLDIPRPSFATRAVAPPPLADETREPLTAPPDAVADAQTTELPQAKELPPRKEIPPRSQAPVPPPELTAPRRPQAVVPASAKPRLHPGPPASIPAVTTVLRPDLPRIQVVRNPVTTSSGSGGAYVVRIWDTAGRPLVATEASLVVHTSDGSALGIPLEPGPEAGEYHVTVPHDHALHDLRVRVMASDARFELPVER